MPFLQSFTSLFSRPSRGDSFSLPTVTDGSSPGPSRRGSYQPPVGTRVNTAQPDQYGRGTTGRYPPLSHTFHRLRNALVDTFPELIDTINEPVFPDALADFEHQIGAQLPAPVREMFLAADGQDLDTTTVGGLFYGLYLLPLDEVLHEWMFWRQVEKDPRTGANPAVLATMASIPPQWVKSEYTCAGWLPLISDRSGNYVGVDLDPGPGGSWGQTIIFGRDFDRKCVLWHGEGEGGWGKWLAAFVDDIEGRDTWEAEKASDDEDEIGYTSYSSSDVYGESGRNLRLAGEYKGWNVLEAWWDKSVKKWEGLGLGMDVAEIERGLDEARRLAGASKGKSKERESIDFEGIRADHRTAEAEIPSLTAGPPPGSPNPEGESLLPPVSPEVASVPRILHPHHAPAGAGRAPASDHPLKDSDLLSPPVRAPSRGTPRNRPPPPAPAMLDLPTRADVQAAEAVADAEASGLRGGWVMNLDTSAGAAARRARPAHGASPSMAEMVDIDLEGGRQNSYGTPAMTRAEQVRQAEQDRLSYAGIEHRRSPVSRTPTSPLSAPMSRGSSASGNATPRESTYATPVGSGTPPVVASAIRRPPAIVDSPRSHSPVTGDSLTGAVIRGVGARRPSAPSPVGVPRQDSLGPGSGSGPSPAPPTPQRGSSVISNDSAEHLLSADVVSSNRRANGGAFTDEPNAVNDVSGELEEIKL